MQALQSLPRTMARELDTRRGPVLVSVVVTLVLLVAIILYIVYRVTRSELKSAKVLKKPRALFGSSSSFTADVDVPATSNGQEYTLTFWLYLAEFMPMSSPALVLRRGGTVASAADASPLVFLDKSTNRLYFALRTSAAKSTDPYTLADIAQSGGNSSFPAYVVASVEYVPLQRWVQYTLVVQDSLATVFQDGDIYTVENAMDKTGRPVLAGARGNFVVGADTANATQVRGFITGVTFSNYAMAAKDVRRMYERGPAVSNGFMAKLGIPEYGLRSPVYRVDDAEDKSKE